MTRILQLQRAGFIAGAALLFLLFVLGKQATTPVQVLFLTALVILAGLPHGALDPLVAHKAGLWRQLRGFFGFLLLYLGLAAAALGAWLLFPGAALLVFLLYSGFHFSGDWRGELPGPLRLSAGIFIVSAPALFHPGATEGIFALLAGPEPAASITALLSLPAFLAGLGLLAALASSRCSPDTRLELGILGTGAILFSPLLFFILYFCGLHSPRHLIEAARGQRRGLVLATAAGFSLLAVALAGAALWVTGTRPVTDGLIQVIFIGLAVLTVPHMLLVEYAAGAGTEKG